MGFESDLSITLPPKEAPESKFNSLEHGYMNEAVVLYLKINFFGIFSHEPFLKLKKNLSSLYRQNIEKIV